MKFTNICKHCKKKFMSDCHETFCPECESLWRDGTLRECDKCGHTWIGECGYCASDCRGNPIELCDKCEKEYEEYERKQRCL